MNLEQEEMVTEQLIEQTKDTSLDSVETGERDTVVTETDVAEADEAAKDSEAVLEVKAAEYPEAVPESETMEESEVVQESDVSAENATAIESVSPKESEAEIASAESDTGTVSAEEGAATVTAESEVSSSPKRRTFREKWEAFRQKISAGHVVVMMVGVLVLLIAASFTVQFLRPEPEPEIPVVEEEEPKVIVMARISSTYVPTIIEIDAEVSEHTSHEAMLVSLKGWVKEFGRVNIREDSNTDSMVLGQIVYGDTLSMYEEDGEFTRVRYVDPDSGEVLEGYCYTAFLSREEPDSAQVYLNVPLYKQGDSRWASKMIGGYETLGSAGCTTTCISMVESYVHGQDIYPNIMADQLPYTYDGLLTFPSRYTRYAGADYMQVMLNLLHAGMPCLVSGYTPDGRTHWVVVVGYSGNGVDMNPADFVINDPGANRYTLARFFRDYPLFEKIVYYTG